MSQMIEQVAKAIEMAAEKVGALYDVSDIEMAKIARAAIEAMREPTGSMIDAAATVERYAEPGAEWGPMIAAALQGDKKTARQ